MKESISLSKVMEPGSEDGAERGGGGKKETKLCIKLREVIFY
jgi:hypothetical protein